MASAITVRSVLQSCWRVGRRVDGLVACCFKAKTAATEMGETLRACVSASLSMLLMPAQRLRRDFDLNSLEL